MVQDQANIKMDSIQLSIKIWTPKMNSWMAILYVMVNLIRRKQKIIKRKMNSLMTRPLEGARVALKFLNKQPTIIVRKSHFPISWMILFLLPQICMNSCIRRFQILSKGANGPCYTGNFLSIFKSYRKSTFCCCSVWLLIQYLFF